MEIILNHKTTAMLKNIVVVFAVVIFLIKQSHKQNVIQEFIIII